MVTEPTGKLTRVTHLDLVRTLTCWILIIVILLAFTGCASVLGPASLAVDAITGGVSIYQRYQDRQVQQEQTEAIRALKASVDEAVAEMRRLREVMTHGR